MNTPERHEQSAMQHMAKARELNSGGDPAAADAAARLAIREMRASVRARLVQHGDLSMNAENAETYSAFLIRLRTEAGFAERTDLARAVHPVDDAAYKSLSSMLRRYEVEGKLPRPNTLKLLAPALGVSIASIDPKRFKPGATPAKRLPAKAPDAKPAAPTGAYLRGITIEPAGEGLMLVRFEAVIPTKGSQDLIARLLQSAALATA